jgi:hypothetical protein
METFVRPQKIGWRLPRSSCGRDWEVRKFADFPRWQHGSEHDGGLDFWPERVAEFEIAKNAGLTNLRVTRYAGLDKDVESSTR